MIYCTVITNIFNYITYVLCTVVPMRRKGSRVERDVKGIPTARPADHIKTLN